MNFFKYTREEQIEGLESPKQVEDYINLDQVARILLDDIFGYGNFQNEIVWIYRSAGFSKKKWSEKHDVILFYSKSKEFIFNLDAVREMKLEKALIKDLKKILIILGKYLT